MGLRPPDGRAPPGLRGTVGGDRATGGFATRPAFTQRVREPRTLGAVPDHAERLRDALRRQRHAQLEYERARRQPSAPEESGEDRTRRLDELRAKAEAATTEMDRLRPGEPTSPDDAAVAPPLPPGVSN